MKLSIKFSMIFLSVFIFVLCIFDMSLMSYKIHETNTIVSNASYQPIHLNAKPYSSIKSNEELIKEVIKNVVLSKESEGEITVEILTVDFENGLLDLSISQTYQHLNGKVSLIKERKTIILEEEI
ncbi:MAG: hypothetical protein ACLSSU_07580 [Beduini sp.]